MKALVDVQPVGPGAEPEETVTRTLKAGAKHYANGRLLVGGDTVELTKTQAIAFADKLEADKENAPRQASGPGIEETKEPSEEEKKAAAANLRPVPTSSLPQDIGAKTATPGMVDSNPGNLTRVPQPPAAVNPPSANADTAGHPPIYDAHLATLPGGNRTAESVLAEAGQGPAATPSTGAKAATAGTAGAQASVPAATSDKTPATKTPDDLTSRGDKKK